MNWLVALLAFAGIFAVLSTVTTIVTEGVHKIIAARSGGLQRMLRSLHHTMALDTSAAATDLNVDHRREESSGKASKDFAAEMAAIPTKRDTPLERLAAKTPILKRLGRRFDGLSKLQFVEQLAQTEFGRDLAQADRPTIERKLALMSYQFDRLGEAQTSVFRMRAKLISSLAAFAFVVLANVNAVQIYRHLASNEEAMAETLQFLNIRPSNTAGQAAVTDRIEDLQTKLLELEAASGDPQLAAEFRQDSQQVRSSLGAIGGQLETLSGSGLPMGQGFFPYCGDRTLTGGFMQMLQGDPASTSDQDAVTVDTACGAHADKSVAARVFLTRDGWVWLLSMIASAGLLGLGAPFWFNVFRTAAQMTGKVKLPEKLGEDAQPVTAVSQSRLGKTSIARPGKNPDLDTQVDVFLINSGRLESTRLGQQIDADARAQVGADARGAVFVRDPSRPRRT